MVEHLEALDVGECLRHVLLEAGVILDADAVHDLHFVELVVNEDVAPVDIPTIFYFLISDDVSRSEGLKNPLCNLGLWVVVEFWVAFVLHLEGSEADLWAATNNTRVAFRML